MFAVQKHYTELRSSFKEEKLNSEQLSEILYTYNIGDSFRGYAARLSPQMIAKERTRLDLFSKIDNDHTFFYLDECETQTKATWVITRALNPSIVSCNRVYPEYQCSELRMWTTLSNTLLTVVKE